MGVKRESKTGRPCPYRDRDCPMMEEGCAAWGSFRTRPGQPAAEGCKLLMMGAKELVKA